MNELSCIISTSVTMTLVAVLSPVAFRAVESGFGPQGKTFFGLSLLPPPTSKILS
jgi:hypothetical protein